MRRRLLRLGAHCWLFSPACEKGKFSSGQGASTCSACSDLQYNFRAGMTRCWDCPGMRSHSLNVLLKYGLSSCAAGGTCLGGLLRNEDNSWLLFKVTPGDDNDSLVVDARVYPW